MRHLPFGVALSAVFAALVMACAAPADAPAEEPRTPLSAAPVRSPSLSPGSSVSPSNAVEVPRRANRPPEFRREVRTATYRITGATPTAIQQQIQSKGPGHWAGLTSYAITYGFTARQIGPRCYAKDIFVKVTSDLELPAWDRPTAASASTAAYWHAIETDLRRHEKGHVAIAERTGRDVMHALTHLAGVEDCNDLDPIVDARAHRQIQLGKRAQKGYDNRTNHGRG